MPKRSYPFEENLQPQYKIHIADKDVISNNKKSMKDIYSKTLDLLFKGAKSKKNVENDTEDEVRDVLYDCNSCKCTSLTVTKCWFCDNKLCPNCEKKCNICNEIFCSACSISMYNDTFESTCLNCAHN